MTPCLAVEQHDTALRNYARRLDPENGEDAYHNAILATLTSTSITIRDVVGFYCHATKQALYKLYRDAKSDREQSLNYLQDGWPLGAENLLRGRLMQTHCRKKGHPLTEENLSYISGHRTCKACKRERENAARRKSKAVALRRNAA